MYFSRREIVVIFSNGINFARKMMLVGINDTSLSPNLPKLPNFHRMYSFFKRNKAITSISDLNLLKIN